ncbi:MAG TPA: FAD-dependent oxidoreductase [Micropruina sp.]|nr:FAD-dependent oxidoreductase [Micropruina sp.]
MDSIVIIGGGLAAANAVETLRDEGFDGPLTVVAAEPLLPYERPPLSKEVLQGRQPFEVLHDGSWYDERKVRVVTATEATAIEPAARTVTLDDGEELHYDKLLLATGAFPVRPDVPGAVHALLLRTRGDEQLLHSTFRDGAQVVIVGGGWIAMEVAASARQAGCDVTVLARGGTPLANVLGDEIAEHLVGLHRSHGVDVRTGVTVESITDSSVTTDDGDVVADVVLAATGVRPNTTLAERSGLGVADGIIADAGLRTSDPHVWVAGDGALALNTRLGPLRVEHWDNAIRQGKLAARSMLGLDAVYDWQPYFFTDQFEFSMEYVGHAAPSDTVEIRGDLAGNEFIAYWLGGTDGRTVTAGMNVGIWDVNDTLRAMIGTNVNPQELTDLR